jgi:hypothetical protein
VCVCVCVCVCVHVRVCNGVLVAAVLPKLNILRR